MAKLTKPNYTNVWASAAGGGSVEPNPLKIQTGWVVERPDFEYMNWVQNRQDSSIAYSFQMGVPEWDSTVEYQYSSTNWASFVQYKGIVYKAIQTGTNKNPETQTAYWAKAFDDEGDAQDVQDNLDDHIVDYGTLANLTNAATARTNLDVYSTAQAAQKNGDSGQQFSVADGTTTYHAVSYSQFITKADKNGNIGETFNVSDATLVSHAVSKQQFDAKTGTATETVAGIAEVATVAETTALSLDDKIITPAKLGNGFAVSIGANGYIKLPSWLSGFTIHWGYATPSNPSESITIAPAFANNAFAVVCTANQTTGANVEYVGVHALSTSAFTAVGSAIDTSGAGIVPQALPFWWIAIGN